MQILNVCLVLKKLLVEKGVKESIDRNMLSEWILKHSPQPTVNETEDNSIEEMAKEYAAKNHYDLDEYDEGGFLAINQQEFAKHLILFANKANTVNKELLEALKGLTKEITQPGYPLHSGMTIIWLDKCRAAISKAEQLKQ